MDETDQPAPYDLGRGMERRSLALYLHGQEIFNDGSEPSDFIQDWHGTIRLCDVHRALRPIVIGKFDVSIINGDGAENNGMPVCDVYDVRSTTYDCYDSLFRNDDHTTELLDALGDGVPGWSLTVMLIERMVIVPAYRGQGFGLDAIAMLLRHFDFCARLVAMKPFPLQYEGKIPPKVDPDFAATERKFRRDTNKLRRYYSRLGFRLVRGTQFMVRSTELPFPSAR